MKYQLIHFFSRLSNQLRQKKDRKKEWNRYLEMSHDLPQVNHHINGHILLVRLDDIGDFVLFASSFQAWLNQCSSNITLLGNIAWKPYFDVLIQSNKLNCIWLDKNQWFNSLSYRQDIIHQLEKTAPEQVIYSSYTRVLLLEGIIKNCLPIARHLAWEAKAGNFSDELNQGFHLLKKRVQGKHETENNFSFLKDLTSEKIETDFYISFPEQTRTIETNYFIICPGGNQKSKQWPAQNFASIGKFIATRKKEYSCVIVGGNGDIKNAQAIEQEMHGLPVINLCGKTSLLGLAEICKNAAFAISNDTSAAHLCALQKTPVFVLVNGNRYGRFFPYPNQFKQVTALYPNLMQPDYDWEEKMPIAAVSVNQLKEAFLKSGL